MSKESLHSHLMPQRKKSSDSPNNSRRTERLSIVRKEAKILASIWEWSPKAWLKSNKSEWAFNNKLLLKLASTNNTSPSINVNWVHSCKNKWCLKEWDQPHRKRLIWTTSNKLSTSKSIIWKTTVTRWSKIWLTLAQDGVNNKSRSCQHWSVFTLLMKPSRDIQKSMRMNFKVLRVLFLFKTVKFQN